MSYCVRCGQALPNDLVNLFVLNKKRKFEDGEYCENCAKLKVKEARGE